MQGQELIFLDPHLVQESVSHDEEYLFKDWEECDEEDDSVNNNKNKNLKNKSRFEQKEWSRE